MQSPASAPAKPVLDQVMAPSVVPPRPARPRSGNPALRAASSAGIAALAVAIVTAAKFTADAWMGEGTPWIMYLSAVLLAAWYGGPRSGSLAVAFSILVCDALFLRPRGLFSIDSANDGFRVVLFLAEGVLVSVLIGSLQSARRAAEKTHADLVLAYDTTIEGWARILDLRDRETEGHSRRVAEMTVRVARALGVGEAELVHVRRGALLHDIGKMAIPDAILRKVGPLTAEERAVMEGHPRLAHEWLSPIPFLGPALSIPYCHHEKWDGTGYPRGLKGEQIPLSARIFAAVDIWDALASDRAYRKAWPVEDVREHIRALANTHLDPRVVEVVLAMIVGDATPRSAVPGGSSRRGAESEAGDPRA